MHKTIPIIDLFAGPGGLGEGFTAFRPEGSLDYPFRIAVSVEKDQNAHRTLELRSFFRQFRGQGDDCAVPDDYYRYLRSEITREDLFARHPRQASAARYEAMHAELGNDEDDIRVHARIKETLDEINAPHSILIGGPPCQAYSIIGRSRMQNKMGEKFRDDPRHFLYKEYLSVLARFAPSVFVMENVRGILSSKADGELIFPKILEDLSQPRKVLPEETEDNSDLRYRIYSLVTEKEHLQSRDYIIKSEDYGIPQARHRVILLGVRIREGEDVLMPPHPGILRKSPVPRTVREAIGDLPPLRALVSPYPGSRPKDDPEIWLRTVQSAMEAEWFREEIEEEPVSARICDAIRQLNHGLTIGGEFLPVEVARTEAGDGADLLANWYGKGCPGGVCNHSARAHMSTDLHRYLFAACYAEVNGVSPILKYYPQKLLPQHRNARKQVSEGKNDEMFEDRFRVQVWDRPATTVTAHISKDGHYNIHPDPTQCRSLTVREAARLQTFPDDYFFEGPRTQQFHQVGNAVPPLLAYQIARIVYGLLAGK